VVTPPGTEPARIRELRVLYPEMSIDRELPAAFKGAENDPGGVLRRVVGVLEATTQNVDQRIRSIGSYIDPDTAPEGWLDYLGRWLDLPWDDGLSPSAKRRVLQHADELLSLRGTRAGLAVLMSSLLGADGSAALIDVVVDFPPIRLGKAPLPALLAGMPRRTATLGAKAVVGVARLPCEGSRPSPLDDIVPTLALRVTATRQTHEQLHAVLERILVQYIPAGIRLRVRWHIAAPGPADGDGLILDGNGPGTVGETSRIGRTVVAGRDSGRIDETGLEMALRLK
jgi:phage tail-like protein